MSVMHTTLSYCMWSIKLYLEWGLQVEICFPVSWVPGDTVPGGRVTRRLVADHGACSLDLQNKVTSQIYKTW